jgi:hypothetical protein
MLCLCRLVLGAIDNDTLWITFGSRASIFSSAVMLILAVRAGYWTSEKLRFRFRYRALGALKQYGWN